MPWLLGGLAVAIYLPFLFAPFQFDDIPTIIENGYLRSWEYLPHFFFSPSIDSAGRFAGSWRPLTMTTLTLNYALSGVSPWSYRLFNFLLHGGCTILVYLLVLQLLQAARRPSKSVAIIAAFFFAIHPLQTQTVLHVWKRSGMLSTFFLLSAMLSFLQIRDTRKVVWTLLCGIFAFLSKDDAILLPILLLAVYGWPGVAHTPERRKALLGACILSFAYFLFWFGWIARPLDPLTGISSIPARIAPWDYFKVQSVVLWKMTGLTFLPMRLNVDHVVSIFTISPTDLWGAWIGLLCVAIVSLFLWIRESRWFLPLTLFFVPLILFFAVQLPITMDESRAYLPLVGAAMGCAMVFEKFASRQRVRVVAILLLIGLLIRTEVRAAYWNDRYSLWKESLRESPGNVRAMNALALLMVEQGRANEARGMAVMSVRIAPLSSRSHLVLGRAFDALGDPAAPHEYEEAIRLDPKELSAYNNLGAWWADRHQYNEAIRWFEKALEIDPTSVAIARNLRFARILSLRRGSR